MHACVWQAREMMTAAPLAVGDDNGGGGGGGGGEGGLGLSEHEVRALLAAGHNNEACVRELQQLSQPQLRSLLLSLLPPPA
jgi:hypothetical protein